MIHNAGQSQRARWEHTDIKVDRDLFDLNVFSVVNLTRLILPHFIEETSPVLPERSEPHFLDLTRVLSTPCM